MLDFLPDPKRAPSKADKLSHGPDCAIHPLVGCVIAQNGTPPGVQARKFLYSLRDATIHEVAGRAGDLTEADYLKLLRKLTQWETAGGTVNMPPPAIGV